MVLGHAGGALKSGRYLEYPYWGQPGHREIGHLYTTLLAAVGQKRPYFGLHDPMLKDLADREGLLPEMMA